MPEGPSKESPAASVHPKRFPNEDAIYRAARNRLLDAEIALRRSLEEVAAMRRALPPGGRIPQDYVFDEGSAEPGDEASVRRIRLSELFARPESALVVYGFMYGPKAARPCPMCASLLDSLDRTAAHATQRINLVVVAKSPIDRVRACARERGWRDLRLLSSAGNSFNRDYHAEDDEGAQWPALNVFVKRDGVVRHAYCTELLFAANGSGQDRRHVDLIWPLWNLFDFTPEGRGSDWYPALEYGA